MARTLKVPSAAIVVRATTSPPSMMLTGAPASVRSASPFRRTRWPIRRTLTSVSSPTGQSPRPEPIVGAGPVPGGRAGPPGAGVTVIVTRASPGALLPSFAVKPNVSKPLKPGCGAYVSSAPVPVSVPCSGLSATA